MPHPQALFLPTRRTASGGGAAARMVHLSGSYTGNGTSQSITTAAAIGGRPCVVLVKGGANFAVARTSTMVGDVSRALGPTTAGALSTGCVTAIAADGFAVGSNAAANANATTYRYDVFITEGACQFAVGTYTGTGSAGDFPAVALGFNPVLVWVLPGGTRLPTWRPGSLAGDATLFFGATANAAGLITSLTATAGKFTLGTGASANTSGETYYFAAWGAAECEPITFTGTGADNVSVATLTTVTVTPTFVLQKAGTANNGFFRGAAYAGDLSSIFANSAPTTDMLQAFAAPGYQLGVTANVAAAVYYAALLP